MDSLQGMHACCSSTGNDMDTSGQPAGHTRVLQQRRKWYQSYVSFVNIWCGAGLFSAGCPRLTRSAFSPTVSPLTRQRTRRHLSGSGRRSAQDLPVTSRYACAAPYTTHPANMPGHQGQHASMSAGCVCSSPATAGTTSQSASAWCCLCLTAALGPTRSHGLSCIMCQCVAGVCAGAVLPRPLCT